MMDYELLKERIEIITSRIKEIGGEVQEVCIDEPSSLEKIIQVEKNLVLNYQIVSKSTFRVLRKF